MGRGDQSAAQQLATELHLPVGMRLEKGAVFQLCDMCDAYLARRSLRARVPRGATHQDRVAGVLEALRGAGANRHAAALREALRNWALAVCELDGA